MQFYSIATRIPPDLLAGSVLRPFLGLYGLVLECTSYVVCVCLSFLFVCLLVWFSLVASCFQVVLGALGRPFCIPKVVLLDLLGRLWAVLERPGAPCRPKWGPGGAQKCARSIGGSFLERKTVPPGDHFGTILGPKGRFQEERRAPEAATKVL